MIRQATKADIPALVKIGQRFAEYYPCKAKYNEAGVADSFAVIIDTGVILVAVKDGVITGGVAGVLCPLWYSPETIIAQELAWWMEPEHRRGVDGIKILKAFEGWAKEKNATLISISDLQIDGQYPIGILVERLGYKLTERTHIKEVL
jgi:hypothetical protein